MSITIDMANLYGWFGTIILFIGAILIAYKKRIGFIVNCAGLIFHGLAGVLTSMYFLIICDICFAAVCIWSFFKWKGKNG